MSQRFRVIPGTTRRDLDKVDDPLMEILCIAQTVKADIKEHDRLHQLWLRKQYRELARIERHAYEAGEGFHNLLLMAGTGDAA